MRTFKCRAFVKHLGCVADVWSIDFVRGEVEIYLVERDEIRKYRFDEYEVELLLTTGEFDVNGKEIYAGDIVRGKYGKNGIVKNYEIRWLIGHFAAVDRNITGDEHYYPIGLLEGEVIGNIYETPELLEGAE